MKTLKSLKSILLIAGVLLIITVVSSCSNDDDSSTAEKPTGSIQVEDPISLIDYILTVKSVTVGQDSWLAAVPEGEETSNNFIAQPVLVEKGTTSNVELTFDETAINNIENGTKVVLKLYADNLNSGTRGVWEVSDEPIRHPGNTLWIKTITIYPDYSTVNWFEYYDSNGDGFLDIDELTYTYYNPFDFYESDHLTLDEFYSMMFFSTNTDYYDVGIIEEEWNEGYFRMFSNWAEDDYSGFDTDENGFLDREEWQGIFEDSGWYENYDTNSDELINREEVNTGFFNDWDQNNDGKIDEDEFNLFRPFAATLAFQEPQM